VFFFTDASGSARPWYKRSEFFVVSKCSLPVGMGTHVVNQSTERDGNVSKRDDDIASHDRVPARLEDLEEQQQVCLAKLRRNAHELCQTQYRRLTK